jgi:hypothetical protein
VLEKGKYININEQRYKQVSNLRATQRETASPIPVKRVSLCEGNSGGTIKVPHGTE